MQELILVRNLLFLIFYEIRHEIGYEIRHQIGYEMVTKLVTKSVTKKKQQKLGQNHESLSVGGKTNFGKTLGLKVFPKCVSPPTDKHS